MSKTYKYIQNLSDIKKNTFNKRKNHNINYQFNIQLI